MNDFAKSLEEIQIREGKADEILTREELKNLRKYKGKLKWLAANTRPGKRRVRLFLQRLEERKIFV